MTPKLISKNELLDAGWKERQVDAALDEPDEFGPAGHWLNTRGKPYYLKDRVSIAAFRLGLTRERPLETDWKKWAQSEKPTSPPELTVDFHRIADTCITSASRQFWSLRLSHPVMGRQGGTREKEEMLIEQVLIKLVEYAFGDKLKDSNALHHYLTERSVSAMHATA